MLEALRFLVGSVAQLVLFVFMLRLVLQFARADFRNPLAQAVMRLTNWLIMPLRRALPPIGRIDTASVVAVLLASAATVALEFAMRAGLPVAPWLWARLIVQQIVVLLLWIAFGAILLYALLSLIAPGVPSPFGSLLASIAEPVLRPIRRIIPPLAGLDLSPLVALLLIQALLIVFR
ncbi:MAG: YggT family protein [Steroidobacteraceae bacterium]